MVSLVFLPLTMTAISLPNNAENNGSLQRENSSFIATYDPSLVYTAPKPRKIPYDLPHLPVPQDKAFYFVNGKKTFPGNRFLVNTGKVGGTCVAYVQSKGWNISGNAKEWLENARELGYTISNKPVKGAVFVTNESKYGHVGIVKSITGTTIITDESNVIPTIITSGEMQITDERIIGYILPQ